MQDILKNDVMKNDDFIIILWLIWLTFRVHVANGSTLSMCTKPSLSQW